jgi:hypothetical protein
MFTSVFPTQCFTPRELAILTRILACTVPTTATVVQRTQYAETLLSLYASDAFDDEAKLTDKLLEQIRIDTRQITDRGATG